MAPGLSKIVRQALLRTANSAWEPKLAQMLAESEWGVLQKNKGIKRQHYSTLRAVSSGTNNGSITVGTLALSNSSRSHPRYNLSIEWLPTKQLSNLFGCPYSCYSRTDSALPLALQTVTESFAILDRFSSASDTIEHFVRSLHVLKPPDNDTDISFSDPEAPFSAFVSVPTKSTPEASWRVAESILHECMHLQLTAIEHVVPLLTTSNGTFYSPWRREIRPVSGVLHGAYAFFGVNDFVLQALRFVDSTPVRSYLRARHCTLREQFAAIQSLGDSESLSPIGSAFARHMIKHVLRGPVDLAYKDFSANIGDRQPLESPLPLSCIENSA